METGGGAGVPSRLMTATLLDAARWGRVPVAGEAFPLEDTDDLGQTPLHLAVRFGHGAMVAWLLDAGANPNAVTDEGHTPLHYAALFGQADAAGQLLLAGASARVADAAGHTPLHMAQVQPDPAVRAVFDHWCPGGMDGLVVVPQTLPEQAALPEPLEPRVLAPDPWWEENPAGRGRPSWWGKVAVVTALWVWLMCGLGTNALARKVVRLQREEAAWAQQHRTLFAANQQRRLYREVVSAVARAGSPQGMNALLLDAARRGGAARLRLLLEMGADPNAMNAQGETPLFLAMAGAHMAAARRLLAAGASANLLSNAGLGPLAMSAHAGVVSEGAWQITLKGRINAPDVTGRTPLHWAAQGGHHAMVVWLLDQGADVNVADKHGDTPLHLAVRAARLPVLRGYQYGRLATVKTLLEAGADVQVSNRQGETPGDVVETEAPQEVRRVVQP